MLLQLSLIIMLMSIGESVLVKRLHAVLDYGILNKIDDWNFVLGVSIAQGQIYVIKNHFMEKKFYTKSLELELLQEKCKTLLSNPFIVDDPLAKVLSPSMWTLDPALTTISPLRLSHVPTSISQLAESGLLTREMSDSCLRSMLWSCSVPQLCLKNQISPQASGYILTHQILYWTVLDRECRNTGDQTLAKVVIVNKCRHVFSQHQTIARIGLPSSLTDLYIEQVVVCGLHGFIPFLSKHNRDFLISLQTSEGCFTSQKMENQTKCEHHLSGVATAALALFLKYSLDLEKEEE